MLDKRTEKIEIVEMHISVQNSRQHKVPPVTARNPTNGTKHGKHIQVDLASDL